MFILLQSPGARRDYKPGSNPFGEQDSRLFEEEAAEVEGLEREKTLTRGLGKGLCNELFVMPRSKLRIYTP